MLIPQDSPYNISWIYLNRTKSSYSHPPIYPVILYPRTLSHSRVYCGKRHILFNPTTQSFDDFFYTPWKIRQFLLFQICHITNLKKTGQSIPPKANFWLFFKLDTSHSCKFVEKNQACSSTGISCGQTSSAALWSLMAWIIFSKTNPHIVQWLSFTIPCLSLSTCVSNRCLKASQVKIWTLIGPWYFHEKFHTSSLKLYEYSLTVL